LIDGRAIAAAVLGSPRRLSFWKGVRNDMRHCFVGLILAAFLVAVTGCDQGSSTVNNSGPNAPKPPGAPEAGPEMLKATKTKTPHK
jgi:hypothetical protein